MCCAERRLPTRSNVLAVSALRDLRASATDLQLDKLLLLPLRAAAAAAVCALAFAGVRNGRVEGGPECRHQPAGHRLRAAPQRVDLWSMANTERHVHHEQQSQGHTHKEVTDTMAGTERHSINSSRRQPPLLSVPPLSLTLPLTP